MADITIDEILGKPLMHDHKSGDITDLTGGNLPSGGTTEQILSKIDETDFNTHWVDKPSGGAETDPVFTASEAANVGVDDVDFGQHGLILNGNKLTGLDGGNQVKIERDDGLAGAVLDLDLLINSSDRTFHFPDKSGTFAMTDDVSAETDPIVGAINGIVKADGAGNIEAAEADVDYQTPFTDRNFIPEIKEQSDATYEYVAIAPIGTAEGDAEWMALRIHKTNQNNIVTLADGNENYDNSATDLTALSYS
jgi:hypothetical protein